MKRISIYLIMSLAAIFAVGCIEDVEFQQKEVVFKAVTDPAVTKTELGEDFSVLWQEEDMITIFHGTDYNSKFKLGSGAGTTEGSFRGIDYEAGMKYDGNYAIYPYSEDNILYDDNTVVLNVNTFQSYKEDGFERNTNPMVAKTEDINDFTLRFYNVCGLIKVSVVGDKKISSALLLGVNDEPLSGECYINVDDMSVTMSEEAETAIMLDCGNGVQLNPYEPTDFWFVVPPVVFEDGFGVYLSDTEGGGMLCYRFKHTEIKRNTVQPMSTITYVPEVEDDGSDDLSALFGDWTGYTTAYTNGSTFEFNLNISADENEDGKLVITLVDPFLLSVGFASSTVLEAYAEMYDDGTGRIVIPNGQEIGFNNGTGEVVYMGIDAPSYDDAERYTDIVMDFRADGKLNVPNAIMIEDDDYFYEVYDGGFTLSKNEDVDGWKGVIETDWEDRTFHHRSVAMRFTADWCGYCPMMAEAFENARKSLSGNLEVISMHCSGGLEFKPGNELKDFYGITGFPTGVVDGRTMVYNYAVETTTELTLEAVADTESSFDAVAGMGWKSEVTGSSVRVDLAAYLKESGSYRMTVLLVEDKIVGYQAGESNNYVHNGVPRAALTDIMGDSFTTADDDEVKTFTYTGEIPSGCDMDNMRIVAYVYAKDSSSGASDGYYINNSASSSLGESLSLAFDVDGGGNTEDITQGDDIDM